MKLVPINGSDRLWAISDIWPQQLVDEVLAIDWLAEPTITSDEIIFRKSLGPQHQCIKLLDEYMHNHIPEINRITNSNFISYYSGWNICGPGYISYTHHDGELPNNMLIFWHAPDSSYGTTFYNSDSDSDIFHQFEFVAGTGYFMLNHPDNTGHRPVQYHGMQKPVPENQWRLVSGWQFFA